MVTLPLATGSARYVTGPWRYGRVEKASHWIPLDAPEAVNALLLDFLAQTSGPLPLAGLVSRPAAGDL
jgi:pimeloyl-ACP methyl ester carboxylesterase